MGKNMRRKNAQPIAKKKRITIVLNKETNSITIFDKKGNELIPTVQASKIEFNFENGTINVKEETKCKVFSLDGDEYFSYEYIGNVINSTNI